MEPDYYAISVRRIEGATLDLRLQLIYPTGEPVPEEKGFALALLCDALDRKSHDAPLAIRRRGFDSTFAFVIEQRFSEFITSVQQIGHSYSYPPPSEDTEEGMRWWEDRGNAAWVDLRVVVSDPRWIEHIDKGSTWNSSACDSGMIDS